MESNYKYKNQTTTDEDKSKANTRKESKNLYNLIQIDVEFNVKEHDFKTFHNFCKETSIA